MVKRKRYRRRNGRRRRSFKRRRIMGRNVGMAQTLIPRRSPLGKRFKATLRYHVKSFTVNPTGSGFASSHVFSANGMYDPDVSGIGHQPMGFDQLMEMYQFYTVIGARIKVDFISQENTYNQYVGIYSSQHATNEVNPEEIIENGLGKVTVVRNLNADTGRESGSLVWSGSTKRFMGRPNPLSEDNLRGTDAANPQDQYFFHIWSAPAFTAAGPDTAGVTCVATLEYVAVFTEPKFLGGS